MRRWSGGILLLAVAAVVQATSWLWFFAATPGLPGAHRTGDVVAVLVSVAFVTAFLAATIYLAVTSAPLGQLLAMAVLTVSVLMAQFADLYLRCRPRDWNVPLHHPDALLVTVGTFTTAGTAGLTPETEYARALLVVQMLLDTAVAIVLLVLVIGIVSRRTRASRMPDSTTPAQVGRPL